MATTKKQPTNADIYQLLGRHGEQISAILTQVRSTNGRVTTLENWKRDIDAVDIYKEKNTVKTPQEVKEVWTTREKTLVAIITSLIALAATLAATGKL